jgi:hypothetical protein
METTSAAAAPRHRTLLVNLIFAACAAFLLGTIGVNLQRGFDDSAQYRQAARNIVATGDAYATTIAGDALATPYPNPPLLAYLLVPILPLGEEGGRLVWFLLNVAAWAVLLWLSLRVAGPPWARRYWGPLAAALALSPPTYLCLLYGQLGIMLGLLLLASFALAPRRPAAAGATLALAVALKLYPGLVGLHFLLRGPRRVLAWATGAGLALLAVPVVFNGFTPYRSYVEKVLLSGFYPYAAEFNVSLLGFWRRLFTATPRFGALADAPALATALTIASALLVLGTCLWAARAPGDEGALLAFSLWFCAALLLSPINGYYNLAALVFPGLVIARELGRAPSLPLHVAAVICTILLCLPPGWYESWPGLRLDQGWSLVFFVPSLFGLGGYFAILAGLVARRGRGNGGMLEG